MPGQPTFAQLHIDRLLTNISLQYRNQTYIADQIFPIVLVTNRSDLVPAYNKSDWFRSQARPRAAGARSARGGFNLNHNQRYFCERNAIGFEIADEYRDNTDAPYDLDRDGTNWVTDQLQLLREVTFASQFMKTGVWGTDQVGGTAFPLWSDYATSHPLIDLTVGRDTVQQRIGRAPNTIVFSKPVWSQLKWHPEILDSIKYTQLGVLSTQLFGELTEFTNPLIGGTIVTDSAEGVAESSVTYDWVWPNSVLIDYSPGGPSLMEPAAGYTFVWQRVPGAIQYIQRIRDQDRELDVIEGNSYFDQQVTGADAGLFMSEVI